MSGPATLSPTDVAQILRTFRDLLRSHQEVVNRLNVYPVPDGDTGTNMALTIESVVAEIEELDTPLTMATVCKAMSHGSLMGARGNSGVILSQMLRGIAETFAPLEEVDAAALATALTHADVLARRAVVRPVEGTILSVAKAAGEGATQALDRTSHVGDVARGARASAIEALAFTPEQLPVLKRAGVVDSGGTGFVLLIDALCHHGAGDALPIAPPAASIKVSIDNQAHSDGYDAVGDLRYEVMYLLEAPDETISAFKQVWAGIGDSIVVVGGDGIYNCHIHTDDIGASIEAAIEVGRPKDIRVTDLMEQVVEERWVREGAAELVDEPSGPPPTTAVVAVVSGDGIGRIFGSLGVSALVKGGQSMNPSTAELVEAVKATGSDGVVILPNNKNIIPVALQVNELVDVKVSVVATESMVEGFAALLSYDPDADALSNAASMRDMASSVIAAEVTKAVRDSDTEAGAVKSGDWIGLCKDGVSAIADSLGVCIAKLLQGLIDDSHELVTVIEGEGSSAAETRRIGEWLAEEHPGVSMEVHHGGQPLYPYLFGIE
jgi:DAK2 domain fusion protein YloV